jgi:hypothetical protein
MVNVLLNAATAEVNNVGESLIALIIMELIEILIC